MKEMDSVGRKSLIEVGSILKKKRQESSYTLEQVSEITRIRVTILKDIEEGNVNDLPGMVFVRGFIRNYGKLLGVDCVKLLRDLDKQNSLTPEERSSSSKEDSAGGSSDIQKNRKSMLGVIVIFIILLAGGGYYFFNQKENTVKTAPAGEVKEEVPVSLVENPDVVDVSIDVTADATEDSVKNTAEEFVEIKAINLVINAIEKGWVRVKIDNGKAFDLFVEKGGTYQWAADKKIALTLDQGKIAKLFLNEREIKVEENKQNKIFDILLDQDYIERNR